MNAITKTIRMNAGRVELPVVSNAELARRLELFEIALREEKIEQLQAQLVLQMTLKNELVGEKAELYQTLQRQNDFISELELAGNQLADDRDSLKELLDGALAKYNNLCTHSERVSEKLFAANSEIKRLNALEPDKTRKLCKRLQSEKAQLQQQIDALVETNREINKKNRALDVALDKAVSDINSSQTLEPIVTIDLPKLGHFEIYGTDVVGVYTVMDLDNLTNQQVQVLPSGSVDVPRPRPIPKAIQAGVAEMHQQLIAKGAAV